MIFHRLLAAAGDKDEFLDPGSHGFFNGVLDQRLVNDGQHFLWHRFGCGQKPGA